MREWVNEWMNEGVNAWVSEWVIYTVIMNCSGWGSKTWHTAKYSGRCKNCGGPYGKASSACPIFLLTAKKTLLGIPRFFDALLHLLDCYPVYKASFVAVPCSKKWPLCDQPLLVFVQDGIALHLQNTTLHFKALPNSTKYGILLQRATPVVSSKVLCPVRNAAFNCYKAPLWFALRFKKLFADYKVCIIVHFFQREFSVHFLGLLCA